LECEIHNQPLESPGVITGIPRSGIFLPRRLSHFQKLNSEQTLSPGNQGHPPRDFREMVFPLCFTSFHIKKHNLICLYIGGFKVEIYF